MDLAKYTDADAAGIAPRAVSPGTIVAAMLHDLQDRAAVLGYDDPAFAALLERATSLASGLEPYLTMHTTPASAALTHLAAATSRQDWTARYASGQTSLALEQEMLSGHLEGQFLRMLVLALRPRRVLEVGLFTGYSALAMAEALPADGVLIACEVDAFAAAFAREQIDRSPHGQKVRIHVGPAADTMAGLAQAGKTFDFVFIDADKAGYGGYLDLLIGTPQGANGLLAADGLICVDNTLMQGQPWLDAAPTGNGRAIAEFNRRVADNPCIEQVLLPIRDGVTLIRRVAPPAP